MKRIRLLKQWMGYPAGTVTEVEASIADRLVREKHADLVTPKRGPKPSKTKVAAVASTKG